MDAVHPCRRREHNRLFPPVTKIFGSSLQAQGTLVLYGMTKPSVRFIPAGAGNTTPAQITTRELTVHPCRRREHHYSAIRTRVTRGSSLQAQGTHGFGTIAYQSYRFIPAGAGNTPAGQRQPNQETVHPCRRREHWQRPAKGALFPGSSLQAQGTLPCIRFRKTKTRFIPAGAGNTQAA